MSATAAPPRLRVTPVARRIAREHGVALDAVVGSGPGGRILRADVLRAVAEAAQGRGPVAPPAVRPAAPAAAASAAAERAQPLSRVQKTIARRMLESTTTVPQFQVETEVEVDAIAALRAQLKQLGAGTAPSLNDFVVKAAALALREHPRANASFAEDRFVLHESVHVGVAVAAEDALVVPVVRDADRISLTRLAAETRRLAEQVRGGRIAPQELEGATFTISNLGMFGITAVNPIVDRPQAAILGVGAARSTLARRDGEIVDRQLMTLTLSCDHRILYGADAARFLARIRELLEQPLALAL
jgi:pyruvate dehydrogenase E2 component (dihydrolipoamide acetyltransferase)